MKADNDNKRTGGIPVCVDKFDQAKTHQERLSAIDELCRATQSYAKGLENYVKKLKII